MRLAMVCWVKRGRASKWLRMEMRAALVHACMAAL